MSTNFYWRVSGYPFALPTGETWFPSREDPQVHLGKRSNGFSWAQDPDKVEQIIKQNPGREMVEDEYGRLYTGEEFLDEIGSEDWRTDSVGEHFF